MSKDHVVSVRLTESEYRKLLDRAEQSGRSLSDEMRALLTFGPSPAVPPFPVMATQSVTASAPANIIYLSECRSARETR